MTNLEIYQHPTVLLADNFSSLNDGIPDWWKLIHGLSITDPTVPEGDADRDGYSNFEEFLAGTDPQDPNSKPKIRPSAVLTIPNAWAIYTASNQVQVSADIRSTNRYVTVKAAEVFTDSPGTTGRGFAMSASDGRFDSTNETGTSTLTASFPYGERHELFIHAQGIDKLWSPYQKVIINPNINDILDKIQTNYSAFVDLQFSATTTEKHHGVVYLTSSSAVKMKGPYKMRRSHLINTECLW